MKVYIETYGCWLNKAESQIMRDILEEHGHTFVNRPEMADIIIINTCAVRLETEQKMISRIKELSSLPGKKLIVAGCLASARPGLIARIAPNASLLAPGAIELVHEVVNSANRLVLLDYLSRTRLPRHRGGITYIVPIASGCTGSCTFCIDRIARRKLQSYPIDTIVVHIRDAIRRGAKEVYITAQDVASYGLDIGTNLVALLKKILSEIPGTYWIRLGMMEPHMFMKMEAELISIYRDERMYKHVHLPLQSGDNRVLKLMNRRYTAEEYEYLIESLRNVYPYLSVTTDVIVGFPGEDELAFRNTKRVITNISPDKVNIARYGIRLGTPAANMPQIPEEVKKRRSRELSILCREIAIKRNRMLLGDEIPVLIIGKNNDQFIGRAWNYKRVVIKDSTVKVGEFVNGRVIDVTHSSLIVKVI